ncbi:MAG: biotin transporter BioY [Puniceicoccales bacterium]|jgi:biotin transport system substrate-specific component|nr:biotin transporter BioY [Puniceicoccales bacterium]
MKKNEILGKMSIEMGNFSEVLIPIAISMLMFVSTLVRVPFYPVPFTLQTLALPLICFFSSRKHALWGIVLFTACRVMQAGSEIFLTIGYIMGFFAMVWILTSKTRVTGVLKLFARVIWAQFVALFLGAIVLSLSIGLKRAFVCGFLFFALADILKAIIAVGVYNLVASKAKKFSMER